MSNLTSLPRKATKPPADLLWPVRRRFPDRNAGFTKGEYWGYVNAQGEVKVDFKFTYASRFQEGLAGVRVSSTDLNRFGFIYSSGELVITDKFYDTSLFAEGLCGIHNDEFKHGYIDRSGQIVVSCTYDAALDFSEGLAAVELAGSWGAIDTGGKIAIPIQYAGLGPYREGLATYSVNLAGQRQAGYMDREGTTVIAPEHAIAESFSEGLGLVYENRDASRSGWGFVDAQGQYRLGPFPDAHSFHEGLAPVCQGGRWGFVDQSGVFVIPAEYTYVKRFSDGLAGVYVGGEITPDNEFRGGKWGFIDRDNRMCIGPAWDDVDDFAGGLCKVELGNLFLDADNHRFGYINQQGDYVWAPS